MRLYSAALAILTSMFSVQFSQAQEANLWVPHGIETLRQSATSKSNFSFDHSMLVLASKLDGQNEDLRRVIAGVNGVSVSRLHFADAWQYDAGSLRAVKEEYRAAGWTQMMDKHDNGGNPGMTDVWIRMENNAISNVAILLARANDVNFVEVSGSINPIDLSHLGGHFGIPRIEGGVAVPNTTAPGLTTP